MHGEGGMRGKEGMHGKGVCMVGGGMCGRGWVCMAGGHVACVAREDMHAGEAATEVGSMYPTGMHSCSEMSKD